MMIDMLLVAQVVTVAFGITSMYLGLQIATAKKFIKELGEALTVTSKAIEDDKITVDELKNFIKEWTDVIDIFYKVK